MKKIFTTVHLLCSLYMAKAQSYIPFPTANALWTERHSLSEINVEYYCYGINTEDTLIGSVLYHKLYKSSDSVLIASEYIGGLREDGAKRIYYYDAAKSMEILLYDFSMHIGDTLHVQSSGPQEGILASTDSVLIAGVYHKRYNFKTYSGASWTSGAWVEGLGNVDMGGLLGSVMTPQPTCDCSLKALCFKQGGNYIYHNPGYSGTDCFGPVLSIPEIADNRISNYINPNPVSDISWLNNNDNFKKITIFTITGVAVYTADLAPMQMLGINKSAYPAGIYYYRLDGGSKSPYVGRLVIE